MLDPIVQFSVKIASDMVPKHQNSVQHGTIHFGSRGPKFGDLHWTSQPQTPKIWCSRYETSVPISQGPCCTLTLLLYQSLSGKATVNSTSILQTNPLLLSHIIAHVPKPLPTLYVKGSLHSTCQPTVSELLYPKASYTTNTWLISLLALPCDSLIV